MKTPRFQIIAVFVFLLCGTSFFASAQTPPEKPSWQEIHSGLEYKKISSALNESTVLLHAFKIDLKKVSLKPLFFSKNITAKKMTQKEKTLLSVNANFFDEKDKPLGLVMIDQKIKNEFKAISWWGVFCLKNNQAKIIHSADYKAGLCDDAIQAGPRLLVNGIIPKIKEEVSRRTAIAINKKQEIILVVSQQPISMKAFAELFQKPESEGGLECVHALNLDGGTSSQVFVQTEKFSLDVPGLFNVPVGLGVFRKN